MGFELWTVLQNIHEGGDVGSQNRKRGWAQCWSGFILIEPGHGEPRDRKRGGDVQIWLATEHLTPEKPWQQGEHSTTHCLALLLMQADHVAAVSFQTEDT